MVLLILIFYLELEVRSASFPPHLYPNQIPSFLLPFLSFFLPLFPRFLSLFLSPAFLFSYFPNTQISSPIRFPSPISLFLSHNHLPIRIQFRNKPSLSIHSLLSTTPAKTLSLPKLDLCLLFIWMSSSSHSHPSDQIIHSMKRQLPFSSMRPPFVAPADYHRFAPDPRPPPDQQPETIVVKSPVSLQFLSLSSFRLC